MKTNMSCKERVTAAIHSREVDYVPMIQDFWMPYIIDRKTNTKRAWNNERERLAIYRDLGWDTKIHVRTHVTPGKDVKTETIYEKDENGTIIHQTWDTPAGKISERLRLTEDWPEAFNRKENIELGHDFRTPRYIEVPFKNSNDLDALEYLFPENNPIDEQMILEQYREKKALSEEFGVPLIVYMDGGMDWFMWLHTAEEAVLLLMDRPEDAKRMLSVISKAKKQRLQMLLELGVDAVIRRGWYESADFWSPEIFKEYAMPELSKDIAMTHSANAGFIYLMMTGIMPLLSDLASLDFDCLCGAEPVLTGQDQRVLRKSLPGKAIFGGISGPEHLSKGTPENTVRGVEEAFEVMGKTGFILGPGVGFRHDWSWDNMEALDRTWKSLR